MRSDGLDTGWMRHEWAALLMALLLVLAGLIGRSALVPQRVPVRPRVVETTPGSHAPASAPVVVQRDCPARGLGRALLAASEAAPPATSAPADRQRPAPATSP